MKHIRVVITGRVQGVWFRAWTQEQARALGLVGWVRNRADGAVEAVVSGPEDAVREMLARLWRGPPAARVASVSQDAADAPPDGDDFVIRRDGG